MGYNISYTNMGYYFNSTQNKMVQGPEEEVTNLSLLDSNISDYETLLRKGTNYDFIFCVRKITLPLICVFGIVGNSLAFYVFSRKSMRNSSCNMYLAARSVTDTGFLISLFFVWLDFVQVSVFNKNGVCQILLFLSSICSFQSVWFVLVITCENYIRICHAMKVQMLCNTKVAKIVIATGCVLSLVFYNFPLWGIRVQTIFGQEMCLTLSQFVDLEMIFIITDTFLTLIIPTLIIFVLFTLIIFDSLEASKRSERLKSQNENQRRSYKKRKRLSPHGTVTRLLTSVSVTFILLHTPNHVIRLKVILEKLFGTKTLSTPTERTLQQIFVTLSYLNYSINSLVYLCCGQRFRNGFVKIFCKVNPFYNRLEGPRASLGERVCSEHCSLQEYTKIRDDFDTNFTSAASKIDE